MFFFRKYNYATTQPKALIAHLKKYGATTTSQIAKIKGNGVKICNVSNMIYKARKILKSLGKEIVCNLVASRKGSYGVYHIQSQKRDIL